MRVLNLTKFEERVCYDSHWEVVTDKGTVHLKLYDGQYPDRLKKQIEQCSTINEVLDLQPGCFYYD
jgi:hypothetical protein